MSLVRALTAPWYHGTTASRAQKILSEGFLPRTPDDAQWLSTSGTYFVIGRPLVAKRFARLACLKLLTPEAEIVLKISPPTLLQSDVLDLSTDLGHLLLYSKYRELFRWIKRPAAEARPHADQYLADVSECEQNRWAKIAASYKKKTVIDAPMISMVCEDTNAVAVVAYVQHGPTWFELSPGSPDSRVGAGTKSYRGIRNQDHIEVAINCPELIQPASIEIFDMASEIGCQSRDYSDFAEDVTRAHRNNA